MDEEDIADAEDARKVQTTEAFAGLGSTQDDAVRRGALVDLFRAQGETVGVKLLKKMGWKEGQGVGPKVRRHARLDAVARPGDDTPAATHLFAPENTHMIAFVKKNDHKGLGFNGETKLSFTTVESAADKSDPDEDEEEGFLTLKGPKKKKKPIRGGIGIGILNDTGSDDEDPYEIGPKISYNRVIGGDKKKKKATSGPANPLLKSKPVFISKKAALAKASTSLRKCHDGRLPLDGFILSIKDEFASLVQSVARYAPPGVPEGWVSSKQARTETKLIPYVSTADAAKGSQLDPRSRASILGEAALPGKSVFDFLTPAARDRLVSASGKTNLPQALGEIPKGYSMTADEREKELLAQVPKVDKYTADAALSRGASGFMPYGEDEAKRARYRAYLENQSGILPSLPPRAPGVRSEDWLKELKEFANCAQIFKPMSGMMATRFTTSTTAPKLASDAPDSTVPLLSKPTPNPGDPAEQAAKLGMYGPMTRSVKDWYPTRLLCKRFNIKPPAHVQPGATEHVEEGHESRNVAPDLVSKSAIDMMMRETHSKGPVVSDIPESSSRPTHVPIEKPPEVLIDAGRNEALEGQKAGEAVFKAIFGDDSDDE
jgi:G patch domain-containing protein 1